MDEVWKYIDGYGKRYQISTMGSVRAIYKYRRSRILKPMMNKDGYLQVNLSDGNKIKHHRVHRLVANAFIDNPNNYSSINHKDFNKTNNCIDNLEWCTTAYNLQYGSERRIGKKVSNVPRLSATDVIHIRKNCVPYSETNNIAVFAKKYKVSKCCISNICSGKSWKHIKEDDK